MGKACSFMVWAEPAWSPLWGLAGWIKNTQNVGPHSWFEYGIWLSAKACPFFACSITWKWSSHRHWWLLCAAACITRYRRPGDTVTAWKFCCPLFSYFVLPRQGTYWETNACAGRVVQFSLAEICALLLNLSLQNTESLVPSPNVSPLILIPIIGYIQSQSSTAHTMTKWLLESWTLHGHQSLTTWQAAQTFCSLAEKHWFEIA